MFSLEDQAYWQAIAPLRVAADLPPTAVPEARARVQLSIRPTELGRIALKYSAGTFSESDLARNSGGGTMDGDGSLAVGASLIILVGVSLGYPTGTRTRA